VGEKKEHISTGGVVEGAWEKGGDKQDFREFTGVLMRRVGKERINPEKREKRMLSTRWIDCKSKTLRDVQQVRGGRIFERGGGRYSGGLHMALLFAFYVYILV